MPHNPFTIQGARDLSDIDLQARIAIYRDLRDRLRDTAQSVLSALGQVEEALSDLEAEAKRRSDA